MNTPITPSSQPTLQPAPESVFRIAIASFAGTTIEFFDYYAYGLAAALVLNQTFFPELSQAAGLLAAFATFGVAFVARPLGAALFGHFGDRIGRKRTLVVSLVMMGGGTFAIGLLPGYATWGIWAAVLLVLLRFIQGIGLGGEWGGAALIAVEHAPPGKRGLYAMFPQLGPAVGFILANLVFLACRLMLTDAEFLQYGWRIPFLVSFVLVMIGLYVRIKLSETPVFQAAQDNAELARTPFIDVLRHQWRTLLLGAGGMVVQYTLFYTAAVFCLSYAVHELGLSQSTMLLVVMLAMGVMGVATASSAALCDRWGRRRVVLVATGLAVIWGLCLFPLMNTGSYLYIGIAMTGCLALMGFGYGPMGAFLPELFATRYRYSGASLAYSLGGILGGALPPMLAIWLSHHAPSWTVGAMISGLAVISFVCVLRLPETQQRSLEH